MKKFLSIIFIITAFISALTVNGDSEQLAVFTVSFSEVKNGAFRMTVDLSGGASAVGLNFHVSYNDTVTPVKKSLKSSLSKAEINNLSESREIVLLWDTVKVDSQIDGRVFQAEFTGSNEGFSFDDIQINVLEFYAGGADLPDIPYEIVYNKSGEIPPPSNNGNALMVVPTIIAAGFMILIIIFHKNILRFITAKLRRK